MALVSNLEENLFGIPAPNAYTVVTAVEVRKQDVMTAENEGDEPVLVSKHMLRFETKTYFSEASKGSTNPIGMHGYTVPFDYTVTNNVIAYCYDWLKSNVGIFANATDA